MHTGGINFYILHSAYKLAPLLTSPRELIRRTQGKGQTKGTDWKDISKTHSWVTGKNYNRFTTIV